MRSLSLALLIAASLPAAIPATASAQAPVPLYDNLGRYSQRISTRVPQAQRYFDQGLRLTYAFNHGEAIRAFREAARLDSTCAICWWGVANAYGPNINLPMDSAAGAAAYEAVQRAVGLRSHAGARERAYIDALAQRFGADPLAERGRRDSAYALAIADVARRYPADADAATLAAAAMMELRPWNYWAPDGTGYPGMAAVVALLERVLARNIRHPGACHYYIHAVESSPRPERALACARLLESAMPGAGHLVHMPGHLYLRLGMYDDARRVNIHAAHADESYIADQRPDGIYALAYYPHNLHFLWAAAAFEGRWAAADSAMQRLRAAAPYDLARQVPPLEIYVLPRWYHRVWFGRWGDILADEAPPADLVTSTGVWHYARGRALAATGRAAEAQAELDSVRAIEARAAATIPAGITIGFAPPATILGLAHHILAGELAAAQGRADEGVRHLEVAVRLEDGLTYNEPSDWYHPARLSLGAVLMQGNRAAEAEVVYREELRRHPNSGWALTGLVLSLRAQGKTTEAAEADTRRRRAWARADVQLERSRY